jgi:ABC-type Mn2+/Zn2+ transport system permease subunit
MGWLTEPFASSFMVRAALGVTALGIAAPLAGCWIVLRRLTYLSDAMSHAVLAGVASAAVAAVAMALGTAALVLRVGVPEDAAVGVSGQGLFALGVVLLSVRSDDPRALSHILFGNPLTLSAADVVLQLGTAAVVVVAAVLLLPLLTATTFDPVHARTVGVRVGLVETAVLVGLGLTVVIGLSTVGALMAIAMVIVPATAARLVTTRLPSLLAVAVALGVAAGSGGLLLGYHLGLPPGPTIALLTVAEVAAAAAAHGLGGLGRARARSPSP